MSRAMRRGATPASRARGSVRPFLQVPIDLLITYGERPAVIGIYACIARLNMIYKRPVALSRADLAHWYDAERDQLAGCIKRAIDDLDAAGWLIVDRSGHKLQLLAAWGSGRTALARPLQFDRPDRGRPARVATVALPLDLFDLYLGRLQPDPSDPATIARYFDRALLGCADIGVYAMRQIAAGPLTPRLQQLGLGAAAPATGASDQRALPELGDLLAQAAAGTLRTCDHTGAPVTVALAPAGVAHLQRLTARAPAAFVAQTGSPTDRSIAAAGSRAGSAVDQALSAAAGALLPIMSAAVPAWDDHGL